MEDLITIKNCNNIKNASISLKENEINIKFGSNGTGKSTISNALYASSTNDVLNLDKLLPYGNDSQSEGPAVENNTFKTIRVFNEDYIANYVFKGDTFLNDPFKVFIKSEETEKLSIDISSKLIDLQNVLTEDLFIKDLYNQLPLTLSALKFQNQRIGNSGGIRDFITGKGAGFEKYNEIDEYKPFYDRNMESVIKWANWRNKGSEEIVNNLCPFCARELSSSINNQNETFKTLFKNSALSTASEILKILEASANKGYIDSTKLDNFKSIIGNKAKSDEIKATLQQIANETAYLQEKINKIVSFRPMNVSQEQLDNINLHLEDMKIDSQCLPSFYTTDGINKMIEMLSSKIDILLNKTGELKGLFNKLESRIVSIINKKEEDINDFFAIAGFPYIFRLQKTGENRAEAKLYPVNINNAVSAPKGHLSYGERNAFALVMFMFEAISDNADLIVLDDPVTSFDENKKFAIIRRLFDNQKPSFRDRTVLLLTHDMQPIIDYVYGNFFVKFGLTTRVNAALIQNNNGTISEKIITKSDLANVVQLTKSIAEDENQPLSTRVVNMRKNIELTNNNYSNEPSYNILSNLIHGRIDPIDKEGIKFCEEYIDKGLEDIKRYNCIKTYKQMFDGLSDGELLKDFSKDSQYTKIISARLLFERNDDMFKEFRRKNPESCKFLNESNHIENDYVYQLDPRLFYSIPEKYLEKIVCFIECYYGKLETNNS